MQKNKLNVREGLHQSEKKRELSYEQKAKEILKFAKSAKKNALGEGVLANGRKFEYEESAGVYVDGGTSHKGRATVLGFRLDMSIVDRSVSFPITKGKNKGDVLVIKIDFDTKKKTLSNLYLSLNSKFGGGCGFEPESIAEDRSIKSIFDSVYSEVMKTKALQRGKAVSVL